jgi:hypothetical protein
MRIRHIVIIAVTVRFLMLPFLAHPYDIYAWYGMISDILFAGRFQVTYYTPMLFYTFVPFAYVYQFVSAALQSYPTPMSWLPASLDLSRSAYGIPIVPGPVFDMVSKSLFLIGDLLVGATLYVVAKHHGFDRRAVVGLWLLNPYVMWISSGWGMFDCLPAFFSLASLALLITRRSTISSLCLSIAAAYKLYPVLLIIPNILFIIKRRRETVRREVAVYLGVFFSSLAILILPAIAMAQRTTSFFFPNLGVEPLGFGLTYWSAVLLFPVSPLIASYVSIGLLAFILMLTFWMISHLSFKNPLVDMSKAHLSLVIALYLTQRVIPEQFFVWSLPYIILLAMNGNVEQSIYRIGSALALLYAVTNVLLPFYMLPLAAMSPQIAGALGSIVATLGPLRVRAGDTPGTQYYPTVGFGTIYLSMLGTLFSVLMLLLYLETLLIPKRRLLEQLTPKLLRGLLGRLRLMPSETLS